MVGFLFDLDQTLIDSSTALTLRKSRSWPQVYALIRGFKCYDGVAELLALLTEREVPHGIVTSSPAPYCLKVIEHHQLRITKPVCYHDTADHKPHSAPIAKGIERLGLPPDRV